jgi:N-acetylneuraminate synthase/N,N'-diacetyllegionaminate synthase
MENKKIKLGNRYVGDGEPCFIIAEIGSNHDGKLEQAKQLIDVAVEAGADAIKFQIFSTERLLVKTDVDFELIKNIEFKREWVSELFDYCKTKGIIFLATPFDNNAVDILDKHIDAFKIASGDLTYFSFLEYITKKQKPLIVSTGKSNLKEVRETIDFLKNQGAKDIAILHCVATYPADIEEMNLKVIPFMKKEFELPIGLSDHSASLFIPALAVALGANIIEKHFTIDKSLSGPDHAYALNPNELKNMIAKIRITEKALGSGIKEPSEKEKKNLLTGRRGIYSNISIKKGTIITEEMISCVRPQKGLSAKDHKEILGKRAKRNIQQFKPLTKEDIDI